MSILVGLSVGDVYQNIAFYTLLLLLCRLNHILIAHPATQKKSEAGNS
ncbi:MAG: hypothetical protein ACXVA2_24240 [Mucilaginibacter sp.]